MSYETDSKYVAGLTLTTLAYVNYVLGI